MATLQGEMDSPLGASMNKHEGSGDAGVGGCESLGV